MPSRTFTRRLVDQMFWAIKKIWLTLLKRTTLHWSLLLHAKMIGKFSLGLFKIKYLYPYDFQNRYPIIELHVWIYHYMAIRH